MLKGDFEQRRPGWSTAGNKAACFECGDTDRFKAQCPIWLKKKEKWDGEGSTSKGKGKGAKGKGKRKSALIACLGEDETDPRNTETPENEVNFARRNIRPSNVLGGHDWGGRMIYHYRYMI